MNKDYSAFRLLKTGHLQNNTSYTRPTEPTDLFVDSNSPADYVFTDFQKHAPHLAKREISIQDATHLMKVNNVESLLVVDHNEHIIGQVSLRDLEGLKPAQAAQLYGINLTEVNVGMLMIPREKLQTLDYQYIKDNRVGHIERLFHDLGVDYITVVDGHTGDQIVRGIFSRSRVSRMLGYPLIGDLSSQSLADMNKRF